MARRSSVRTGVNLVAVALLAATLSGCGRKGALQPPPDPSVKAAQPADASGVAADSPLSRRPRNTPIKPPTTPFILDPLL